MTVRPTYEDITYTVIFKKYDGGNLSVQHIAHGHAAVAPTPELIPGHTFTGWDKDFSNITSDLTVNPIYTAQVLTVRFLAKDGTTVWSTQSVEYGKDAIPPSPESNSNLYGSAFLFWKKPFNRKKNRPGPLRSSGKKCKYRARKSLFRPRKFFSSKDGVSVKNFLIILSP